MHLEILDDWCCICIVMPVFVPNLSILLIMFSLALPACDDLIFSLQALIYHAFWAVFLCYVNLLGSPLTQLCFKCRCVSLFSLLSFVTWKSDTDLVHYIVMD